MSTEEVKFNQQVSALNGSQGASGTGAAQQKKFDANAIAEAFKKFAEKNGIKLTTESFLQIINSHPEIVNLAPEQQANALLKIFNGEQPEVQPQPSATPAQSQQPAQAEQPAAQTGQPNPFNSSATQQNELFTEVMNEIKEEENYQKFENFFNPQPEAKSEEPAVQTAPAAQAAQESKDAQKAQTPEQAKAQDTEQAPAADNTETEPIDDKEYKRYSNSAKRLAYRAERYRSVAKTLEEIGLKFPARFHSKVAERLEKDSQNFYDKASERSKVVEAQREKARAEHPELVREAERHNGKKFERQGDKSKEKEYINSCARNIYDHSDAKKTSGKSWEDLSKKEKAEFEQRAHQILKSTSKEDNNRLTQAQRILGVQIAEGQEEETSIEHRMFELQAANADGKSIEEFRSLSREQRLAIMADYVDKKYEKDANSLSDIEKAYHEASSDMHEAMNHKLIKEGKETGVTRQGYQKFLEENADNKELAGELNTALKEYYEDLEKSGDLSPRQKTILDAMRRKTDAGVRSLQETNTSVGPSKLEESVISSSSPELKEAYQNAKTYEEKANIVATEGIKRATNPETKAIEPEAFIAMYADANKAGNEALMSALLNNIEGSSNAKEIKEQLFKQYPDAQINMSADIGSKDTQEAVNTQDLICQLPDEQRKLILDNVLVHNSTNEQSAALYENLALNHNEASVESATIYAGNALKKLDGEQLDNTLRVVHDSDNHNAKAGGYLAAKGLQSELSPEKQIKAIKVAEGDPEASAIVVDNGGFPSDFKDSEVQRTAFDVASNNAENDPNKERGQRIGISLANDVPNMNSDNQLHAHETLTKSKYEKVSEAAAANIHKYDKSVQVAALKATYNSGNEKAIQVAASNINKMDKSVQAEAMQVTFATNNTKAIETALLQVNKMDADAVNSIKSEIETQIAAMEEKHVQSIIEAFGKRQVNKELGMKVDNNSQQFKTKLEKYIEELRKLPTSEIYRRLCSDVQFWPTDMQVAMLERASKYCPRLFNMMLEKYGIKLLSFGQVNSSTRNEILMQMLKSSTKRAEAMEYLGEQLKSKNDISYSDAVKDLYNKLWAEKFGNEYDKVQAEKKELAENNQTIPMTFGSQTGSTRTNLNTEDTYWKTKANLNYYLA